MSADIQQFEDKELVCVDREHPQDEYKDFVWTKGEQKFMQQLHNEGKIVGDVTPPKRCPECRRKKKARYERSENIN